MATSIETPQVPRLLPYPGDVDQDGVPWYFLDTITGDIVSFKPVGRQPTEGPKRLERPRTITGSGKYGVTQLTVGKVRKRRINRTRNAMIIEILEHFWGM